MRRSAARIAVCQPLLGVRHAVLVADDRRIGLGLSRERRLRCAREGALCRPARSLAEQMTAALVRDL